MDKTISKKVHIIAFFCIAMATLALHFPMTCYGQMQVEASPNLINIDAERYGDIRIFTDLPYSDFDFYGDDSDSEVFIYINPVEGEVSESIANISPSRDSLGNLILRFGLEDLLERKSLLNIDDYNTFQVVVIKTVAGTISESIGQDDEVFIIDKKGF